MSPAHIALRHLFKSYDGRSFAVEDVSLEISKGEFITLLGPSGSGKTTTLMMLAGFEQPSSGEIELNGKSLAPIPPYRRNIGVTFQNYALFPHMTAAQNVAFPLRMRKIRGPQSESRVQKALGLVGLVGHGGKLPSQLSGGQQQRVALARALVFEPDVLLLDEPLGALDKNLREQMQVEIKRIHGELGITMVYVTHDQTEAMTMSDRVVVFRDGRIQQVGRPLEIYARPASRFVGEFIGDSNMIEAVLLDPAQGLYQAAGFDRVAAGGPPPPSVGAGVDILVRPESVRILAQESDAADNRFDFAVVAKVNYGNSILLIGDVAGVPFRVRSPGTLAAEVPEGTSIRIGWNRGDAFAIRRE